MRPGEIKPFLEKVGKSEEEMDFYWESCSVMGTQATTVVKNLASHGLTWRDLNVMAAGSLIDVYNRMLKEEGLNGQAEESSN